MRKQIQKETQTDSQMLIQTATQRRFQRLIRSGFLKPTGLKKPIQTVILKPTGSRKPTQTVILKPIQTVIPKATPMQMCPLTGIRRQILTLTLKVILKEIEKPTEKLKQTLKEIQKPTERSKQILKEIPKEMLMQILTMMGLRIQSLPQRHTKPP
jgi:hypothetical protein